MDTIQFKYTSKYSKKVIDEIIFIKDKYGLTAENLVKYSSKTGELRKLFEWDNEACGEKWREQQARIIINEIKLIIEDKEIFAFENVSVNLEGETKNVREYFDTFEIRDDAEKNDQVINRAYSEILYWMNKFESYVVKRREFSGVLRSIAELKQEMEKE